MEKVIRDDVSVEFYECAAHARFMLSATSVELHGKSWSSEDLDQQIPY